MVLRSSLQDKEPFVMVLVASHIGKPVWVVFGSLPGGWFFVYLPEKLATI